MAGSVLRRAGSPWALWLGTPALGILISACGNNVADGEQASTVLGSDLKCETHATVSLAPTEAELDAQSGDIEVTVTVAGPEGAEAWFMLRYSTDGETWSDATLRNVEVGEPVRTMTREARTVVWDSLADLGYGRFETVALEVMPFDDCGPGEPGLLADVVVDNVEPLCAVTVSSPTGVQEGKIVVPFTLAHDLGAATSVQVSYSLDHGDTFNVLHAAAADCDGDGEIDGTTGLATSTSGVEHCIVWDSQVDVLTDESVIIGVSCWAGSDYNDFAQTAVFPLENNPTPDPAELLITELMLTSAYAGGTYMEIFNRTHKALRLDGLQLSRWAAGQNPYSSSPRSSFVIRADDDDMLMVPPRTYAVISASEDPVLSGCVRPDATWPFGFTYNDDSTYRIEAAGETIVELSIVDDVIWDFGEGVAMGLDTAVLDGAGSWAGISAWCPQRSRIRACQPGMYTELGTPAAPNDRCL